VALYYNLDQQFYLPVSQRCFRTGLTSELAHLMALLLHCSSWGNGVFDPIMYHPYEKHQSKEEGKLEEK
jgi:hypothetical protein